VSFACSHSAKKITFNGRCPIRHIYATAWSGCRNGAARAKADEVVARLKAMRLAKVAGWFEETVDETLVYFGIPHVRG